MNTLTQPLRDEHKELIPHIEKIVEIANSIPEAPLEQIRGGVKEVHEFLAYHLIPHAQAEDAALYPAVQRALGSQDATRTMTRDQMLLAISIGWSQRATWMQMAAPRLWPTRNTFCCGNRPPHVSTCRATSST